MTKTIGYRWNKVATKYKKYFPKKKPLWWKYTPKINDNIYYVNYNHCSGAQLFDFEQHYRRNTYYKCELFTNTWVGTNSCKYFNYDYCKLTPIIIVYWHQVCQYSRSCKASCYIKTCLVMCLYCKFYFHAFKNWVPLLMFCRPDVAVKYLKK